MAALPCLFFPMTRVGSKARALWCIFFCRAPRCSVGAAAPGVNPIPNPHSAAVPKAGCCTALPSQPPPKFRCPQNLTCRSWFAQLRGFNSSLLLRHFWCFYNSGTRIPLLLQLGEGQVLVLMVSTVSFVYNYPPTGCLLVPEAPGCLHTHQHPVQK